MGRESEEMVLEEGEAVEMEDEKELEMVTGGGYENLNKKRKLAAVAPQP